MTIVGSRLDSGVARAQVEARLQGGTDRGGTVFRLLLQLGLLIAVLALGVLLVQVFVEGWPVLADRGTSFLSSTLASQANTSGVHQALRGTLWIGLLVIFISFPLGIAAALYLEEYAPSNRLTNFIELNIRNLAGVPAVVYGLLGLSILVQALDGLTGGQSILAAGITMAILALPIVIITSAEAVRAVPSSLREAGYGVGATKWEVIRSHVLPYAAPGILTGTLLSLARALGEAAPLILVGAVTGFLGSNPPLVDPALTERFTALPIVITEWTQRPQAEFKANAAAAIIILLVIVLLANVTAILLRNHYEKKRS